MEIIFYQNLRQQIIETLSIYGKITDNTEISLRDKDKNQFSLKEILQKHKGKYVYIDFWASWCQPCLEMFPYSFKLSKKFSSSTVFLYLSIDKNFNNWIKSASKNKLTDPQTSYIISNFNDSEWIKQMKITEIPRYMLFDKNGELIRKDYLTPKELLEKQKILD